MRRSGNVVSFWSAGVLGIAAIAGNAMWVSIFIGGGIAVLSGHAFGRLGSRCPAAGSIVE